MKEVIAKYKYRGDYALAEVFAFYLKEYLEKLEYDLITVIPLSEERLKERGFNQAQALLDVAEVECTPATNENSYRKAIKEVTPGTNFVIASISSNRFLNYSRKKDSHCR